MNNDDLHDIAYTLDALAYSYRRTAKIFADPTESEPARREALAKANERLYREYRFPDDVDRAVRHSDAVATAIEKMVATAIETLIRDVA